MLNIVRIAAQIITNYKSKFEKVQNKWEEETKNLQNKPTSDTNGLLMQVLKEQVKRMNKSIDKAEKYAQSIVEINERRQALKEEAIEKENKTNLNLKKLEKERKEKIKKKNELLEEKKQNIKTQKREYYIKLRKKKKEIEKRFEEL